MKQDSSQTPLPPGFYLVATPIGNLRDITLRALDVLGAVNIVACEDTRVTGHLLSHYGIKTPSMSFHEHNEESRLPQLMAEVQNGKAIAIVSDAGTPLISDPGYRLVREAAALGLPIFPIPGASSVLTALCKSGLASDRFCFAGFLPAKTQAARRVLEELAAIPATLILFESPRRLAETLPLLADVLGNRQAVICRELTKLYEEARRGSLSELAAHYATAETPKGEVVLVIDAPEEKAAIYDEATHDAQLLALMKDHSLKDAVAMFAEATGLARKEVYARALGLKKDH